MDKNMVLHSGGGKFYSDSKHIQNHESQIRFISYGESIKNLTQDLSVAQKEKLSRFFDIFLHNHPESNNLKKSNIDGLKNNPKSSKKNFFKQKRIGSNKQIINEQKNEKEKNRYIASDSQDEIKQQSDQFQARQFNHEERESLKNAFRYICRLVFKQAHKYSDRMIQLQSKEKRQNQLFSKNQKLTKKCSKQRSSISVTAVNLSEMNLLEEAQLISGERYFKQFMSKLSIEQRRVLLRYMIWFLRTKYLRYINKCNNQNKGKRKQMRKDLYIRFKNTTMLPYLEALMSEISM